MKDKFQIVIINTVATVMLLFMLSGVAVTIAEKEKSIENIQKKLAVPTTTYIE